MNKDADTGVMLDAADNPVLLQKVTNISVDDRPLHRRMSRPLHRREREQTSLLTSQAAEKNKSSKDFLIKTEMNCDG